MPVDKTDEAGEGFLSRWSRRKREVAAADAAPPAPVAPERAPDVVPEAEPDLSLLPKIEDITAETDLAGFFQKGVPEALKNAALRQAWTSDAFLKDFIGPAEYAWDFNDPTAIVGFGPIDASVDVEAMARGIFGEAPPKPEADAGSPEGADAAESLAGREAEDAEGAAPVAPDAPPMSCPDSLESPVVSVTEAIEGREEKSDNSDNYPAFRRHGGAMPQVG